MKRNVSRKLLSLLLCMMLCVAAALFTTGCNDSNKDEETESIAWMDGGELGEGSKTFTFTVVDGDGKEAVFTISTDKKTVGEALQELELITGEQGEYGLYVKTVNGVTADYDKDGTYWAFYINGEYGMTGVDVTTITEGESYSLKVEKG